MSFRVTASLVVGTEPPAAWTRFVSHGTYLRSLMSPCATSSTAELNDDNISTCEKFLGPFVDRWFRWLDEAETVPEAERAELRREDHLVRQLGYQRDPMNVLAANVFGEDEVENMINLRMGNAQMRGA